MTQNSWCWECTGVGDGDARTVDDIINQNMLLGNWRPDQDGVIYWTDGTALQGFSNPSTGLLAPTNPAGNTVRIASGAAIVQGWLYANDANVDFDVSGGNANATDLIVLRRGDPATVSSVRLALVRGPGGGTATVTQTSTTWEIALAEVLLDGAGNFSALTDVREFAQSPLSNEIFLESIAGDGTFTTVDFTNIDQNFTHLKIVGYGRSDAAGGTSVIVTLRFNGDAGAGNYNFIKTITTLAAVTTTQNNVPIEITSITGSAGTTIANAADPFTIIIPNYRNTTLIKTALAEGQAIRDGIAGAATPQRIETRGWWLNTAAITRIELAAGISNWTAGSIVSLYGLRQ
jgi:hypothetical protein